MKRTVSIVAIVLVTWCSLGIGTSQAQVAGRGTDSGKVHVAAVPPSRWIPARTSRAQPLQQKLALDLSMVPLADALETISRKAGLKLGYSGDVRRSGVRVSLKSDDFTVLDALTQVLQGTGFQPFVSLRGDAVLVAADMPGPKIAPGSVTGRVTDAKTGLALARTEVFLNGTKLHAETDTTGRYQLAEVEPGNYTLVVRRFGYAKWSQAITVAADRTDTVDVALDPAATRLNELVTTATGRQRRLDIANDVTTINADSVMQVAPIRSVTDLLEGRVPGLTVQHTSGAPGDPSRLRLRGAGSPLRSNDPIVFVDGVRVYADQSAARSANLAGIGDTTQRSGLSRYATPSPLDYIDPNSIETIEVLKGPSAATLYGPDAANGVILITTKKGKAGPTRWTASVEHGRTRIEDNYPELYLRWGHLPYSNTPVPCRIDNTVLSGPAEVIVGNGPAGCQGDSLVSFQLLNDPALTVLDQGQRTALTLGASGGNQTLTYAVTGSYQGEVGLPKLPDYEAAQYQTRTGMSPPDWMRRPQHLKRWGVTSRLTARLGETADLSLTATFSRTQQQRSALEQQLGLLMSTYLDRTTDTYYRTNSDARIGSTDNVLTNYFERATAAATQFTPGLQLNWRPRGWLTVSGDAGLDVVERVDEIFLPRGASTGLDSIGHLDAGQGSSLMSTANLRAVALAPLGLGLRFQFAAGVNYTGRAIHDLSVQTSNLPPGTSARGATVSGFTPGTEDNATFGWYLEPSLSHRKFSLSLGLRVDGSGVYGGQGLPALTFPPRFPKLGFSYLLSDESWFPFKDQIQSFRVRVAYGRAGRQPGPTDRFRLYGSTRQVYENGQYVPAVFLQTLGNADLRPERSSEFEGGFDADLLDNRITVSVTSYRKTTDDALLSVPLAPSIYGNGVSVLRNIGRLRNTGLEFTVGAQLVRSGPVTWTMNLGVGQNRNVVVALGPGIEPFYTDVGIRVAPGYPLFGRWSTPILGYADANGNGILEPAEILQGDTAAYVGQTLPNYTADLSTTVGLWHGAVTINAGFHYDDGLSQKNEVAYDLAALSRGWNDPAASLAEQLAAMHLGNGPGKIDPGDYNWIQTVNTFRFGSLAVTYTVPQHWARFLGAQRLSVAVQGANLGLWSNYRGLDPNVNAFSTGNSVTDTGVLPQPRTWQVRVNATY